MEKCTDSFHKTPGSKRSAQSTYRDEWVKNSESSLLTYLSNMLANFTAGRNPTNSCFFAPSSQKFASTYSSSQAVNFAARIPKQQPSKYSLKLFQNTWYLDYSLSWRYPELAWSYPLLNWSGWCIFVLAAGSASLSAIRWHLDVLLLIHCEVIRES